MAVKKEIKSHLARLLATEDLIVEHKDVETAQFNVHTRELLLPLWDQASEYVYDMLVSHEVGHALFTPDQDPPKEIPHDFLNVCEDARIEKLMKRKYLGIAKSFYRGYNDMHESDFFEVDGQDIASFNLADRANLYFKIGSFITIPFSDAEKEIINLISNAETFTDTISAAEALYNFCKQDHQDEEQVSEATEGVQSEISPESDGNDSVPSGDSDTDSIDDTGSSISDSDSDDSLEGRDSDFNPGSRGGDVSDSLEPQVQTADTLASKLKDLITKGAAENVYVEITDVNVDKIIASNSDIHNYVNDYWRQCVERREQYARENKFTANVNIFEEVDGDYEKFKNDAKKEVSYLVKEFECKKSANAYSRAATSRTGILDTRNLHSYKYNEDLFKRVTLLPDGKNHGLIFILDWSGSMCYEMKDTIKQLYNLVWFCKKVQIPFEVYAFTNEWRRAQEDFDYSSKSNPCYEEKEYVFRVEDDFTLMNILTSKVNGKELESQLKNIWRTVSAFGGGGFGFNYPPALSLSGTPLNETIIALHKIIPQFQKENDLQKVQCIILTDGEANSIPYHSEVHRSWEDEPRMGMRSINSHTCSLRDRKLGKNYSFGYGWWEFTDTLLKNLKDKFDYLNLIGIRVLSTRDAKSFISRYHRYDKEYDIIIKDWRRLKTFTIKNSGYDAYFGLSSSVLSEDSEFDVDDSATKAQIKRAFVKSLKTKKLNKKVLGEFISLVV